MKSLRFLIWIYFWLLIFEGALRKWVFPDYANILLLVRDPVVIAIYLRAIFLGVFPRNRWVWALVVMGGIFALLGWVQLVAGESLADLGILAHLKAQVVIYGWRTYFLHLPLIFLMPAVLRDRATVSFVRALAILAIPMTLLVVAQYFETGDAWINSATKGGEQLAFVGDKIRAPGTFSFNTGPACFFALLAACGVSILFRNPPMPRWSGWMMISCAVIYAPLGGGRLNSGMVFIVLVVGTLLSLFTMGMGQLRILLATAALVLVVIYTPIFQDGLNSMNLRLASAAEYENAEYHYGFASRLFGGFAAPTSTLMAGEPLFLGRGIGLGTIGGAKLQTGQAQFLVSEGEWGRILLECGWLWGMLYLVWRVGLVIWLGILSLQAFQRGNTLGMLLWSANIWTFLQGQWGQPTNQGFAVLIAGLTLAACREGTPTEPSAPSSGHRPISGFRGRQGRSPMPLQASRGLVVGND